MTDNLAQALSGVDVAADALVTSLHDLTQLAIAIRPDAHLVVENSEFLCPLEKACIFTATVGRVVRHAKCQRT